MLSRSATEIHASTSATIDNEVDSSVYGVSPANLRNLEANFQFMSVERRQQFMTPSLVLGGTVPHQRSNAHDAMTDVVVVGEVSCRQDQPSHDEQARFGRGFQSFDVALASRPVKAHRRSRHNSHYRRSDHYTPEYAYYFDRDAVSTRRARLTCSRSKNASPEILNHTFAASVAPMADIDAKEERDSDRRGTDSYRGGGNKRRRDGEYNILRCRYVTLAERA